jgi:NMD protein affecting ribosome stability and mRNA decay
MVNDAMTDDSAHATVFRCTLCGLSFTHGGQVCGACPLQAGCTLVSCPRCGYSFPRGSWLVEWVGRVLRGGRRPRR